MKRNKKKNDFFKAAFSIFGGSIQNASLSSNNGGLLSSNSSMQSPKPSSSSSNEFVGQCIILNNMKLKITKVLAEGICYRENLILAIELIIFAI